MPSGNGKKTARKKVTRKKGTSSAPRAAQADGGRVALPMRWLGHEHLDAVYANHIFVSHAGTEFLVVFARAESPLLGKNLQTVDDEAPSFVPIKPVAKLVVSERAMAAMLQVLNDNFERFQEKIKEDAADDQ